MKRTLLSIVHYRCYLPIVSKSFSSDARHCQQLVSLAFERDKESMKVYFSIKLIFFEFNVVFLIFFFFFERHGFEIRF